MTAPDSGRLEAIRDSLPAHYFDCDRFEVYSYGTRQGKCDCTAPDDVAWLLSEVDRLRAALDEQRERVGEEIAEAIEAEVGLYGDPTYRETLRQAANVAREHAATAPLAAPLPPPDRSQT